MAMIESAIAIAAVMKLILGFMVFGSLDAWFLPLY
jgi:hypothetical protein